MPPTNREQVFKQGSGSTTNHHFWHLLVSWQCWFFSFWARAEHHVLVGSIPQCLIQGTDVLHDMLCPLAMIHFNYASICIHLIVPDLCGWIPCTSLIYFMINFICMNAAPGDMRIARPVCGTCHRPTLCELTVCMFLLCEQPDIM